MTTIKSATYTNDNDDTYAYDPRVIVEGARVRPALSVATHRPGSEEEVTVGEGMTGTVEDYAEPFYQCLVRLDRALGDDDETRVWIAPDDLTILAHRYEFDADAARPVLDLLARAFEDDVEADLAAALTQPQRDLAEWIGMDGFDPADDTEINSSVRHLIDLAFAAGWMVGPSVPYFEADDSDGMCIVQFHVEGPTGYASRVSLALDWQDTANLIDREPGSGADLPFHTGAEAAVDLLGHLTEQMNEKLAALDAYVAARIAKQPDPLAALLDAVSNDFESEVIEAVQLRAGLLWKCPNDGTNNPANELTCEDCGSGRAAVLGTTAA